MHMTRCSSCVRVGTLRCVVGAEISKATAVVHKVRKLGRFEKLVTYLFLTAVLDATDPNLLNCGSSEVASGTSYAQLRFGSVAASTAVTR